jgi:predicted PurR-regulated permease PerM
MFAILALYILYNLSNVFIPLLFAFFLALVLQPLVSWFFERGIPLGVSIIIISAGFVGMLILVDLMVYDTLKGMVDQKEEFLDRISMRLDSILMSVQASTSYQFDADDMEEGIKDILTYDLLLQNSRGVLSKVSSFSGSFLITILYFVSMLGAVAQYEKFINYLESDNENKKEQNNLVNYYLKVQHAIGTYIKVKTFTSFLTGLIYAAICFSFGLDFYLLWGFLAFSLNFIPAIGSIIATIPPVLMGMMYFDGTGTIVLLILLLLATQFVIGSILDPKLMGSSLSLNFVTVVLGIVFWGNLWGTAGMILSVPMMVLLKVILEQLPDAAILVKLMEPQKLEPQLAENTTSEKVNESVIAD